MIALIADLNRGSIAVTNVLNAHTSTPTTTRLMMNWTKIGMHEAYADSTPPDEAIV